MKNGLEIINASFEKVVPKDKRIGFWEFLTVVVSLIFAGFVLLFLNPLGWVALVICTLLYKFIIGG
jgi:hypothetical protein